MADDLAELKEIQEERPLVKKALRENGSYLGMSGDTLQKYFLTLNEKEVLLLKQVSVPQAQAGTPAPSLPAAASHLLSAAGAPSPSTATGSAATNGAGGYSGVDATPAAPVAPAAPALVARELPPGPTESFNQDSLPSVCAHMERYEASAPECSKALRAIASLAYTNAKLVGEGNVLSQILRLLSLHSEDATVQLYGMKALCNMAYERNVALQQLSSPECMRACLGAIARKGKVGDQACEAVARVVAAELNTEGGAEQAVPAESGPLRVLFTVVGPEDQTGREVVTNLFRQFVANEVATPELLVSRLVDTATVCKESGPAGTAWLLLAKMLAMAQPEIETVPELLITRGAIAAAISIVQAQVSHAPAQLAGIEAMSGLVGTRVAGLEKFASLKGIEVIEAAMTTHPSAALMQTKGIRALASGVQWSREIQEKSGFVWRRCVKLTKTAMSNHPENEELQTAALEAIVKYVERTQPSAIGDIKGDDCIDLVKSAMTRHSIQKLQTVGAKLLPLLGESNWKP